LTVEETAERLGRSIHAVRRMCRLLQLPAKREHSQQPRSRWLINRDALERRLQVQAVKDRLDARGVVMACADGEFREALERRHPGMGLAEGHRVLVERYELLNQLAAEVAHPELAERFAALDAAERAEREAEAIEAEARELADRVRHAERVRRRAAELLAAEDAEQEH
jgi:hypothetical protein